jgi:hypothetical protein
MEVQKEKNKFKKRLDNYMISLSLFVFRMKAQRCIATKQCEVM